MDLTRKKFSKAAKVSLLLFATLVLSTAYFTPHPAKGTSMSNFPAAHEDFLGAASYEAIFDDATGTADPGPNGPMPIIVGPNVRVNAPQQAPPAGLLGRSETTVAVGEDGNALVAGWNDATGFRQAPFTVVSPLPGTPGLSGFGFSTDGGLTWTDGGHPATYAATTPFFSGNVVTRGDPWLTVTDETGNTFFYANLGVFQQRDSANNIVDAGVSVQRGSFTGTSFSWNDGHLLSAPNAPFDFYDKEAIVAKGSTVIVSVTNFIGISAPGTNPANCQFAGGFGQIEVWRSTDGGNTYQGPAIAQPDQTDLTDANCLTGVLNQGSDPAIGKAGNVFVAWTRGPFFFNGSIVTPVTEQIIGASSSDFGAAFNSPVVIRNIVPGRQSPPVGYNRNRYNDFPRVAVDKATGRIYVAFQDASVAGNHGIGGSGTVCLPGSGNPSPGPPCPTGQRRVMLGGGADTDIYLAFSDDNGATWSTPTLITPTAGDGRIQFWPVVTVGPQGEINVVYYESQEVRLNPDPSVIECSINIGGGLTRRSIRSSIVDTFIARSTDHGATFQTPVKLSSASSNWCKGTTNIRPNFGDYIGAATVGAKTSAVWADDRNTILISGTPRNVVDVFYTSARTIVGDVNGDMKVNILDASMLAISFDTRPGDPLWNTAPDLNNDGSIDILDAAILASAFQTNA